MDARHCIFLIDQSVHIREDQDAYEVNFMSPVGLYIHNEGKFVPTGWHLSSVVVGVE